ncbi:MAG TPA: hypothetical protein VFQ45_01620 [Longimicrobium sp.]|nr:hypothetical protein [Longimicrobium sp.]
MKKMRLDLDTLSVESFDTVETPAERGTVHGHIPPDTYARYCSDGTTCVDSCFECTDYASCLGTCNATECGTCATNCGTCYDASCGYTYCGTCDPYCCCTCSCH